MSSSAAPLASASTSTPPAADTLPTNLASAPYFEGAPDAAIALQKPTTTGALNAPGMTFAIPATWAFDSPPGDLAKAFSAKKDAMLYIRNVGSAYFEGSATQWLQQAGLTDCKADGASGWSKPTKITLGADKLEVPLYTSRCKAFGKPDAMALQLRLHGAKTSRVIVLAALAPDASVESWRELQATLRSFTVPSVVSYDKLLAP